MILGLLWCSLFVGSLLFPLSLAWLEGGGPERVVGAFNRAVAWLLASVLPDRYSDRGFMGLCFTLCVGGLIGVDFVYAATHTYTGRMFLLWIPALVLPVALVLLYDPITDRLRPIARACIDWAKGWVHTLRHQIGPSVARETKRRLERAIYDVRSFFHEAVERRRVARESARRTAELRCQLHIGEDQASTPTSASEVDARPLIEHLQIEDHVLTLSEDADWSLFDRVARFLGDEFPGEWVAQLDGIEQRYWDLRVGAAVVTLHFEQDLGVSLFPSDASEDPEAAKSLVIEIAERLTGGA